jgi:hypothetical protein
MGGDAHSNPAATRLYRGPSHLEEKSARATAPIAIGAWAPGSELERARRPGRWAIGEYLDQLHQGAGLSLGRQARRLTRWWISWSLGGIALGGRPPEAAKESIS